MREHTRTLERGFSLFELAMVLTIAGLVVGSFFVGQAMIRTAQVNSVISDLARYTQAIVDFRDKYQSYPGDMPNATFFWGTDPGGCPTPVTGASPTPWNPVPHTATCNGDGNGTIGNYIADVIDGAGNSEYEWFRAWQQLADAGMINNTFNGISGNASPYNAVPGVNIPGSLIPGGGFTLLYLPPGYTDPNTWPATWNHRIDFGSSMTAINGQWAYNAILTPGEAFGIDSKIDDGLPGYGNIRSVTPNLLPNCTTSANQATAQYNAAYSGVACSFNFITGF